ncbi:malectin domain-containing carbohydrate-binding protein [Dyadobacter sp. NIV53]|uniref:CBM96 family carbohydrate-binding protein n=1 Tax=Dyadobacter sp. NIV53 TaxID=2861765 RepID=UPI001C874A09|nr:malectin domain-containing carbohydrate-binding protein [Dyadobacter sp. NIV53]
MARPLQLTVTQQTFPEGLPNAGLLRITRNTPTTNALSVTLSSSDLSEATVPQTAVIPIGKTFIDIPVTTLNDGVTDGNQQVYFTVSASGFSSGSIWVMVTDLNKPDFEIPLVQLSSNSVQTGTLFNYQVSIKNSGSSKAPSGILVRGYLSKDDVIDNSDILVSENLLMEAIDAGQTKILINAAKSPDLSGSFKLLFWVNPDAAQNEILLTNNVSKAIDFTIEPGFLAKASAAATFVQKGTNIPITGSASKADGSPAPNSEVEVYVIVNGIRRNIKAVTDGSGKFTVQFTPLAGEAGHYILGASFPGMNQTTEQDAFDILGVSINDNVIPKFQVILNEPLTGSLKIQNLSNKSLTNFTLDPVTLPDGLTMEFATLASLAGNASVNLSYTIKGSELSNGNNYLEAGLQAKSDEGLNQNSKIYYYCQAANGYLVSNVSSIQASVSQSSGERKVEFLLVNKGKGATGEISVNLPAVNWMKSITPKTISSLSLGDTTVVTLSFLALDEVPFDFPVTGNIGINAANGNSFTIPFIFEKVAEASGTALITVSDQFTYYSEGAPKVQDAKVTIKNYFTGEVYAEGTTNADGVFEAKDIPEGTHRITVEKEHHQTYNNVLEINPGRTVEQDVFLNYQAITFNWTVVPTAIQDEYEVVLESKFETNVPIPVVTIEMPKTMPQLAEGQEYPFNITLTNHGLITAEQVTLMLPTTDPQYEFVTNYVTADLLAQQSIQVPAVMRRKNGLTGGRTMATAEDLPCSDYVVVMYTYKCNLATGLWEQNPATFTYQGRSCPGNGGEIPTPWWTGSSATGYPIGVPPCFIGCDGPSSGGASNIPTVEAAKTSCVACIADIAGAVLGCIPGADLPSLLVCVGGVALDGANHKKGAGLADCALEGVIGKIGGLVPGGAQLLCIRGILKAIETCSNTQVAGGGRLNGMQSALRTSEDLPSAALTEISGNLKVVLKGYTSFSAWMSEYFGDMITEEGLTVLFPLVKKYLNDLTPIPVNVQNDILTAMEGYEIEQTTLSAFFVRWNKSLEALSKGVQAPNSEYPNIINWNLVDNYVDSLINAHNYSVEKEYQTIDDMHSKSIAALNEIIDGQNEGVCASVVVQFNQKVTMTREAFEGTLEISNGHPTDAMKTISVNLMITDEEGTPSNGLFEIQTKSLTNLSDVTGTGEIGAQEKGSVKFLFIPEIGAAPQAPKLYKFGGSITYWDPYAEKVITLPLSAVSITVNPSPNLMLHYFMQRNILGDDALTSPEIEPTIPAELAVMVENKGYGPAVNMTISSAQPKIVDNEKGLAINFSLIGSNFQGQAKQLGITNINFGTIPGLQTRIGQWYFTSSLLGKFVSYDAKVVHSNSFGNPELSLIQGVKLHELTKSIQLYGGLKDGINDFLVNDVFDIADRPDIIYFSQGNRTAKVNAAASGSFSAPVSPPSFTNTLTVTPADTGFNYIKLDDPGNRLYELVSVTRGDGQAIPLDNAWLTFVTLPVSRSPVYENKFHFVDHFGSKGATNYTVIWKPVNTDVPRIDSIAGAPAEVVSEQVKHLKVYFNKGIDASTFTYKDLNLTLQGGANIINSSVIITQLDSATFDVDLSAVTTGNGFFNFTAQAAEITDIYGTSGLSGKQVTWSQFLNTPIVQAFEGLPADRFAQSYSSVGIYFNLPIEVATVTPARFTIYKDKVLQSGSLKIDSVSSDHRLFSLSGLDKILTQSGVYELRVDMLNISSETKVKGKQVQSVFLTVDNTGPTLTRIEKSDEGAIDPLHVAFIKLRFNEGVSGLNTSAFSLTRNGEAIPIRFTQLAFVDSRNWVAGNFGMQTYPDGDYVFSVNLENVVDSSGNIGSGTKQLSWKVNHQSTITISNVTISPDLGFSSTDGYTSGQSLTVGYRLNENASQVTISQIDPSGEVVLSNTSAVAAGNRTAAINISGGGELKIRITATAAVGGAVMAEKALYIDQLPLLAYWKLAPGQILKTQISSIPLAFSSKLLNTAKLLEGIQLRKDGVLIPSSGLGFETVNDSLYKIKGINNISNTAGTYQITFNIQNVSKYSSGKTNPGNVSVSWTVESANKAPLANAGTDISVTKTGTIKLNGTASSDPDSDALTYSWVAPEGIILSDTTAVSPSFTMTEADRGKTYSFMLIVSDGTLFSTDVVVVKFVSGEVTFSGLQDAYCHNSSSQKLTGIPSGGVFSGPGVVGNIFNPSLAGTGTHIISYKLSGQTATRSTTVNAIPGLGKDSTIAIKCANEKVDLTVLFSNMDFTKVWNTDKPEEAGAGIYKLVATNPAGCTDTLIVTVKQKIAIWKGQTSSNWSNPKNWDIMQIPDQETTVIFPANAPRCDLISTASIASIRMEKGSELTLSATAKLVVLGGCDPETVTDISGTIRNKGGIFENHAAWNSSSDGKYAGSGNGVSGHYGPSVATFTNRGEYNTSSGHKDVFKGPGTAGGTQEITGSRRPHFFDADFVNGTGSLIKITNTEGIVIAGNLNFENGITSTLRNLTEKGSVLFEESAGYSNSNKDSQHVNGYVTKVGNQPFTFPVGSGTDSRPVKISAPEPATAKISMAWIPGDPSETQDPSDASPFHPVTDFLAPLSSVSKVGQWDWISITDQTNPITVTVSIPDVSGFAAAENLRLAGWDGKQWIDLSGQKSASSVTENSMLTGTIPVGKVITALGIGQTEAPTASIRINAGGKEFDASANRHFIADRYYGGTDRVVAIPEWDIKNTEDDELYRAERSSTAFNYTIPVRNGKVRVVLHFAELFWGIRGRGGAEGLRKRLFNVDIEEQRFLSNYDIYSETGGSLRAVRKTFTVEVKDGFVNIDFSKGNADLPTICAIEVIPVEQELLSPIEDAYIRNGESKLENFGLYTTLETKRSEFTDFNRRTYLKFSLADVSKIGSARIRLYGQNIQNDNMITIAARSLANDSWTETGINWENAPSVPGHLMDTVRISSTLQYYEMDVTEFVLSEMKGDKMASFIIYNVQNDRAVFHSRENEEFPPQLIIENVEEHDHSNIRQGITETVEEAPSNTTSYVYPNPVKNTFQVKLSSRHKGNVSLRLMSSPGNTIISRKVPQSATSNTLKFDTSSLHLNAGLYLLEIQSSAYSEVIKLAVE